MEEEKIDLKTAFALFKDEKHIDRPIMMGVLKDVFMTQLAKTFGSADNFDVIINVDKGDCEIYQNLEVVEELSRHLVLSAQFALHQRLRARVEVRNVDRE